MAIADCPSFLQSANQLLRAIVRANAHEDT